LSVAVDDSALAALFTACLEVERRWNCSLST
jgi:hypothetical protein